MKHPSVLRLTSADKDLLSLYLCDGPHSSPVARSDGFCDEHHIRSSHTLNTLAMIEGWLDKIEFHHIQYQEYEKFYL